MTTRQQPDRLARDFEQHRAHLRALAIRILGSAAEADDAVQEAWLRLSRQRPGEVEDLRAWLTTVVARVCLDMLRSRAARREEPLDERVPEPADAVDPETEALLADSVGLALLVVLETLRPAERLAFVLHDMFAVPFDEIAPIVGRSPDAARQLASRARRRVRGATLEPGTELARRRAVVDAFLAAARDGDFDALLALLHPDAVLEVDGAPGRRGASHSTAGAGAVARSVQRFARLAPFAVPALVKGLPGFVVAPRGRPLSAAAIRVEGGRVTRIELLTDPARLRTLEFSLLAG